MKPILKKKLKNSRFDLYSVLMLIIMVLSCSVRFLIP